MNTAKRTDRIIIAVIAVLIVAIVARPILGGGKQTATPAVETPAQVTYADYNGKKIGILTGTNMEAETFKYFPDSEYLYFDGYPNMNAALESRVIDAYLADEPAMRSMHAQQPQIDYIKQRLTHNKYSFAFRKNDPAEKKLRDQFNEFLRGLKADGTYDEIDSIWFGTDENKKVVDMSGLTGENGTIHVVTTATDEPFSYVKDGKNVGYDIDVAVRFCRACGYDIEIGDVNFQARIAALESGQYEFTTTMNVTPEREEVVLFSDPVSEGGIVVAVRSEDLAGTRAASVVPSDFDGKRAGVITGSFHDSVVAAELPKSEIFNFNNYTDLTEALKADKIDYFLASAEVAAHLTEADSQLTALELPVRVLDIGAMFARSRKGEALKRQMDEFIEKLKADGTLDGIYAFWSKPESASEQVDQSGLTGENGTLRFATSGTKVPISFVVDGQIAGTDPDIAVRFCREYGYNIEVSTVDTAGIIPGIVNDLYDFSLSDMVVTDERKESVLFSEPYHDTKLLMVVRASDVAAAAPAADEKPGFFQNLARSFERNFIRENRWRLILSGIGVTCLITALATLFGTILAFAVCMFRRTGSKLANRISDWYVKLLQGTPTVVLLMILYYVVFGRLGVRAVWVAVIAFTLNLGAYGSEIMRSGIDSIDGGQREAALALGYTERQAFFDFIFPQAAVYILPVYRGELVNLLKSTSVVGYIAIQDLTKVSDIIRSRTYEAFFPLIATALIYFLLAWVISLLVKAMLHRIDPRARKGAKAK